MNRNLIAAAETPYRQLLSEGFSPDEIADAWRERQRECEASGTPKGMYPQLKKWLEDRSVAGARMSMRPSSHPLPKAGARSEPLAALALETEGKLAPAQSAVARRAMRSGSCLGAGGVSELSAIYREYTVKEEKRA